MNEMVELFERPAEEEIYLIAGWRQWADAGSISSGLPRYLAQHLDARKIGEIKSDGFYMFQIPATHHLLRPEVRFKDGFCEEVRPRQNEFYYANDEHNRGLLIFTGEEPHMNEDLYADAFFDVVQELGVRRGAAVGGVYGSMPYDKDRNVSCTYSMRHLKEELSKYAVKFSNYEGGATIGSYFVHRAALRQIEFFVFNGFVPAYEFAQSAAIPQGVRVEDDFRAWYELMRRFNHMFNLGVDLSELERKSDELTGALDNKVDELVRKMPQLKIREYLKEIAQDFTEMPFMPLDDVWERELGDIFNELDLDSD